MGADDVKPPEVTGAGDAPAEPTAPGAGGAVSLRDPLVLIVLGVYLVIAVATSFIHELGFGPDEVSRHLPYIEWLARERRLPPADPDVECGALELHPPGYYALLTPVYMAAIPWGRRAALQALRLTSPVLVLVVLLLWFAVIRRACAHRRQATIFAFALTAWWPNLYVDAGLLNNDVGALLCTALLLYLVGVRQADDASLSSAALWGAVAGLGGLVKTSVPVAAVPVLGVALVWQHGRRFFVSGRFWARAGVAAAACLAVCGWWFWRNLQLHGSMSGISTEIGFRPIPAGLTNWDAITTGLAWPFFLDAVNGLWASVFAGVVWFPEWSRPVVYTLLRLITAAGLVGVALGLHRLATRQAGVARGQLAAIILPAVAFGTMLLSDIYVTVFVHYGFHGGGRYLLVALPGLTVPLALGLRELLPGRWRVPLMAVTVAFFLCLNFLAWYHIVTYWNPYVLQTAGRFE